MLRSAFLWLSHRRAIFDFIRRNGLARQFAARFVAGETLDQALKATVELNAKDVSVTLDLLGESVRTAEESERARDAAIEMLDRVHAAGARGNLSIKLTQMGLDLDPGLAVANLRAILDRARALDTFVRVDMEASPYVQRTLDIFHRELQPAYGDLVGVVIQSMLRRSDADVADLVERGARVRLVKGAYREPPSVAFPAKADVDAAYRRMSERLLEAGNYPAFGTHDEALITHVKRHAAARGIAPARYEFQLLYGVRRDLQERLRREGYNVRVYVPYGTEWYPYLMRRLAERPANVWFIVGNVARELVNGRRAR
jgi:proline dehydrogenase